MNATLAPDPAGRDESLALLLEIVWRQSEREPGWEFDSSEDRRRHARQRLQCRVRLALSERLASMPDTAAGLAGLPGSASGAGEAVAAVGLDDLARLGQPRQRRADRWASQPGCACDLAGGQGSICRERGEHVGLGLARCRPRRRACTIRPAGSTRSGARRRPVWSV